MTELKDSQSESSTRNEDSTTPRELEDSRSESSTRKEQSRTALELEAQPPTETYCPHCGGEPEPDPKHNLAALGYLHDDIRYTCSECGREWVTGRPIGDVPEEYEEDYTCDACGGYGNPNWIRWQEDESRFAIAMKCTECNYVWTIIRDATNGGAMMGDPRIAGDLSKADNPFEE